MNETIEILRPFMIRANVPLVRDLHELNVDQIVDVLQLLVQDPMRLSTMTREQLENRLEELRCQFHDLLSNEPDEDCVSHHRAWKKEMAQLRSKMWQVEERLAA